MTKTRITEATVQDLKWTLPTEADFKFISEAFIDYRINGYANSAPDHHPDEIAQDVRYNQGDLGAPLKYMIIAAMLSWKELITALKPICFELGWKLADLKTTIQDIKSVAEGLEDLYEKYCEPAIAAVQANLLGQTPHATATTSTTSATTTSTGFNIKVLAQPNSALYRIVVYDPKYGNPGARRHLYLTQKTGSSYRVSLGGATVTNWYNEPFFDSIQQAENFIKNSQNANTSKTMTSFNYTITDKPVASGTSTIISDLTNCVLITSDCGPAYIHKSNQYCVESYEEEITEAALNDLEEAIEKHDELNPALFENSKLKPKVKDKINEIVEEFLKDFEEVDVELVVQDIILTGSNASYNYTKDSDLDIHIVADTSNIKDTIDLHKVIYDAYKSNFNKKFDIELNKVPVELYIEIQDTPLVSNGIYSVVRDEWVKEPTKEDIPEVDQEAIDKAFKPWEKRYKDLLAKITDKTKDESEIDKLIDSLYELRGEGLSTEGEYSIGNLVFKEMRNNGYLDNLKELRHKVIAQRLSLQEDFKNLKTLTDYFNLLDNI